MVVVMCDGCGDGCSGGWVSGDCVCCSDTLCGGYCGDCGGFVVALLVFAVLAVVLFALVASVLIL
jgi:hypothetical protein